MSPTTLRAGGGAGAEAASPTPRLPASERVNSPERAPGPRSPRGSRLSPSVPEPVVTSPRAARTCGSAVPGGGDSVGNPQSLPRLCHDARGPEVTGPEVTLPALPAWGGGGL